MEENHSPPPTLIDKLIFGMVVVSLAVAIYFIAKAGIPWELG